MSITIIKSIRSAAQSSLKPMKRALDLLLACLALALMPSHARAVPYASGISINAGTVSFILNEGADNVTIRFDGGASSQNLGARARGSHNFSLGAATTFKIAVSKAGVAPWTLISTNSNGLLLFNSGRGVAVNQNPASPVFGRIYVANSASGTVATNAVAGIAQTRAVGEGIYILNADQSDALGRGETVTFALAPGFGDYIIGTPDSATGTIRDNELPAACVLFSDDFESDSSMKWIKRFGANNGLADGGATWSVDYGALGIPSAPHSAGGTTRGVQLQVNKDATGSSAAVNIYPAGWNFHGNYALRADMFLSIGTAATTEHAQLGLNHSGDFTNRASQNVLDHPSTAGGDGVWIGIETDAGNLRDYAAYTYPTPASLADDAGATITAIPGGFRAMTTRAGPFNFYRIRR